MGDEKNRVGEEEEGRGVCHGLTFRGFIVVGGRGRRKGWEWGKARVRRNQGVETLRLVRGRWMAEEKVET